MGSQTLTRTQRNVLRKMAEGWHFFVVGTPDLRDLTGEEIKRLTDGGGYRESYWLQSDGGIRKSIYAATARALIGTYIDLYPGCDVNIGSDLGWTEYSLTPLGQSLKPATLEQGRFEASAERLEAAYAGVV